MRSSTTDSDVGRAWSARAWGQTRSLTGRVRSWPENESRRAWLSPSYAGDAPGRIVAIVAALAVLLVPWRSGVAGARGVPWAEDGRVFLAEAYAAGPWRELLRPYEGYIHVPARLVVLLVSPFPIAWQGVLVCLGAVLVQGLLAGFAYCVVRAHVRTRAAAFAVPLLVVLVVVGPETVENLANLQWYLLFAACLAPLWTPATRVGVTATTLVVLAATLASPFGVVTVVFAAFVWVLTRSRALLPVLVAGAVGAAVQLVSMVLAPPRMQKTHPEVVMSTLLSGYDRRILGDGVFGIGVYRFGASITADGRGLVTLVVLLVLVAAVGLRRGVRSLAVPGLLLVLSVGTFALPTVISGRIADGLLLVNFNSSSRYYVAPALLLLCALVVLADQALGRPGPRRAAATTSRAPRSVLAGLVAGLAVVVAFGVVTSYRLPTGYRDHMHSWSSEVARGRDVCAHDAGLTGVELRIAPVEWTALVPCTDLTGGHGG